MFKLFQNHELQIDKKTGNVFLMIWGDLDYNKNAQRLVKILELLISENSLIETNCLVGTKSPLLNELESVSYIEVTQKLNSGDFYKIFITVKIKDIKELACLVAEHDSVLEFECKSCEVSGAFNDNDGSFVHITKEKYEEHKNAIEGILRAKVFQM